MWTWKAWWYSFLSGLPKTAVLSPWFTTPLVNLYLWGCGCGVKREWEKACVLPEFRCSGWAVAEDCLTLSTWPRVGVWLCEATDPSSWGGGWTVDSRWTPQKNWEQSGGLGAAPSALGPKGGEGRGISLVCWLLILNSFPKGSFSDLLLNRQLGSFENSLSCL